MSFPSTVFFKPTSAFIKFIKKERYRWTRIVDVGAGTGHLGSVLSKHGLEIQCIDVISRYSYEHEVALVSGIAFPYGPQDTVITARPCGDGWAREAIISAHESHATPLYVGLKEDVDVDMGQLKKRLLLDGAGEDGECVWEILGESSDMCRWYYIKPDSWERPRWVVDLGDKGWGHPYSPTYLPKGNEQVLAHCRARWLEQLIPRSDYTDDDSLVGWVDPNGKWYGCPYGEHDNLLSSLFNISQVRAELLGFVKVYGGIGERAFLRLDGKDITNDQFETLEKLGYFVIKRTKSRVTS